MATFIDVAGLEAFSNILVFLVVLVALYAIISHWKPISGMKWVAIVIAVVVALLVLLSDLAVGVIRNIAPWFAVLFIFIMFIMVASQIFGNSSMDLGPYKGIIGIVIVIMFIVGALLYIRGETNVPGDVDADGNEIVEDTYSSTANFIFHPNFMGIIFVLLVAIFTIALLAGKSM